PGARLLGLPLGVQRLGSGDDGEIHRTGEDRRRRLLDQDLWRGAPDARVEAVPRRDAELGGQAPDRVVVLPRLAVHDLQAVGRGEHPARTGVLGCACAHLCPHVERLGDVAAVALLGDADDARRPVVHYAPFQTGSRFSANALGPSLASSVAKTRWEISDSSLYAAFMSMAR